MSADPLTKAFDRGHATGSIEGPKPANPYKRQALFNAWETGFAHARQPRDFPDDPK